MYKVFMYKREPEKAQICMNQAQYLAGKYGIMFVFDTVEMPEAHVEEEPAPEVPAE
jgi:hypothetical protein